MPRCIFCESSSNGFTSVEHIIPQSLGNTNHILSKGTVCDKCNNYLTIKTESKILNLDYLRNVRKLMALPSKKRELAHPSDGYFLPEYQMMGRFLGKIGLEFLASRAINASIINWEGEIINHSGLDAIKNFIKYDKHKGDWGLWI